MDEREYSRPLTVHRVSDYPEIKKVLNDLFVELSNLLGRISVDKTRKFLNLVVLDLFVAYKTDPGILKSDSLLIAGNFLISKAFLFCSRFLCLDLLDY